MCDTSCVSVSRPRVGTKCAKEFGQRIGKELYEDLLNQGRVKFLHTTFRDLLIDCMWLGMEEGVPGFNTYTSTHQRSLRDIFYNEGYRAAIDIMVAIRAEEYLKNKYN